VKSGERFTVIPILFAASGALFAGMYAFGRLAAGGGVSPLGLLYWQAVSGAVVVSAFAVRFGCRPQFSLRFTPHYAIAVVLGVTPALIASHRAISGTVAVALLAGLGPLVLFASGAQRTGGARMARLSPLRAASATLIAQAVALDPLVAYEHAIVLPGLSFSRFDWVLLGSTVLSSAFYVTAFALTARTPHWRSLRCTT
jgi:hypothetical protein